MPKKSATKSVRPSVAPPKRSRTAIDAKRGRTEFLVDPNDPRLKIIGCDTTHKEGEHILWQARALEPVSESFAQAMVIQGFTSTIKVRLDGKDMEVIEGRRRVKAARRANQILAKMGRPLLQIRVVISKDDDLSLIGMMIGENLNREDQNPMDAARDLAYFLRMGASEDMAAAAAGKTVQDLRKFLRLFDLDTSIQASVREGKISATAALQLVDLKRDDQKVKIAEIFASGEKTVAAVASVVKAHKEGSDEAVLAPGKRLLTKLLDHENAEAVFGKDGIQALRYAMGELSPRGIKGLSALLSDVKPAKKNA